MLSYYEKSPLLGVDGSDKSLSDDDDDILNDFQHQRKAIFRGLSYIGIQHNHDCVTADCRELSGGDGSPPIKSTLRG